LQFLKVPPVGVADGIDTSAKHAKLSFTVKSLVADLYLDDLRDKTLRGLEGRALAGFATGNVAYGFHTVPVEEGGHVIGNKIEIHPRESIVIRRIFDTGSRSTASGAKISILRAAPIVEVEEPTQALAACDRCVLVDRHVERDHGRDQLVPEALMIPFHVVVLDKLGDGHA